jgi:hypothetical protein
MDCLKSNIAYRMKGWTGDQMVIRFAGRSLTLLTLKLKIMEREKISPTSFDLQLRDIITGSVYSGEEQVYNGASVLVGRVPALRTSSEEKDLYTLSKEVPGGANTRELSVVLEKLVQLSTQTDAAAKSLIQVTSALLHLGVCLEDDEKKKKKKIKEDGDTSAAAAAAAPLAKKKKEAEAEDQAVSHWRVIVHNGMNYSPGMVALVKVLEEKLGESIKPIRILSFGGNMHIHIKSKAQATALLGLTLSVEDPDTGHRFVIHMDPGPLIYSK